MRVRGSYILIIELERDKKIRVGVKEIIFRKGYYAYVGSALNGIEKRVERHLRKDKRKRWHIDYLLEHARVIEVFYKEGNEREECTIAGKFNFEFIKGFGSSDCRCRSHLFYAPSPQHFHKIIEELKMKKWRK